MKILIFATILIVVIGCQKEDSVNYHEEVTAIINVKLPDSIEIGNEVNYKVYFVYKNGCGRFSRHEAVEGSKSFTVTAFATYPDNTTCSANTPLDSTYINFAPQQSGTFIFKFTSTSGFITDSVVVY